MSKATRSYLEMSSPVFTTEIIRLKMQGEGAMPQDDDVRMYTGKVYGNGREENVPIYFSWDESRLQVECGGGGISKALLIKLYSEDGSKIERTSDEDILFNIPNADVLSCISTACDHLALKIKIYVQEQKIERFLQLNGDFVRNDDNFRYARLPVENCDHCGPDAVRAPPGNGFPDFCQSGLNLRLFINGPFQDDDDTDFELHVEDVTFHVHKAVLKSESAAFLAMFDKTKQMEETEKIDKAKKGSATIDDCTAEEMRAFLFTYYDRTKFADYAKDCGQLCGIYQLACKYLVEDIQEQGVKAFGSVPIQPQHFWNVVLTADLHKVPGLMDRCAEELMKFPPGFWTEESTTRFIADHPDLIAQIFAKRAQG